MVIKNGWAQQQNGEEKGKKISKCETRTIEIIQS